MDNDRLRTIELRANADEQFNADDVLFLLAIVARFRTDAAEARIALLMPLVEKWRQEAKREESSAAEGGNVMDMLAAGDIARALRECANDLAALVGAQTRQETTEKHDDDFTRVVRES